MKNFGLSDIEPLLEFTTQTLVSKSDALKLAKKVISGGGEGIMLRKPESLYEPKRSSTLYKIKEVADTEAIITGYKPGTGKYKKLLGSFICSLVDNTDISFNVSGMDDSIRKSYKTSHPVGTMITITYNGYSSRGVPRHPRYLRIRHAEGVGDI
jgi:DNA ligase-1